MALHAVLTVLSEAIKRDASSDEVEALIDAAEGLSPAEREDLRKIPFERLEPYQSDIYLAERDMLVWGFAGTWQCLRQLGLTGDDSSERAFVIQFKKQYPCPTHSVREMAALFLQYLAHDHAPLCEQYPWLLELAEAERLEIDVLYALDNPLGHPLNDAARETFFAQTFDDVLAAQVVRAEQVSVTKFSHDISEIKEALENAETANTSLDFDMAPFQPTGEPFYFAIARDHETLSPVWYYADEHDAKCLAAITEETPLTLEALAPKLLPYITGEDDPEEVQAAKYLDWFDRAFRLRYLLLA